MSAAVLDDSGTRAHAAGTPTVEPARFQCADAAPLVAAAFCCAYCLRSASSVALWLSVDDGTSEATCRCDRCDEDWLVALSALQTLRMKLCPPADVALN
jgi:hypothetical protein